MISEDQLEQLAIQWFEETGCTFLVVNQLTPSLQLSRAIAQRFAPSVSHPSSAARLTVTGTKKPRRPDLVVFVNGLPLGIVELKNPADTNADVWKGEGKSPTRKFYLQVQRERRAA